MNKSDLNIRIATALGFELFNPGADSGSPIQWIYPDKYKDLIYSVPETALPDFIQLIDRGVNLLKWGGGIVPRDYGTRKTHEQRHA